MTTNKVRKGMSLILAAGLFLTGCGIKGDDSSKTKDVKWKTGSYATGITVTENIKETAIACNGSAGAESCAVTQEDTYGVWKYYTAEMQATSQVTVQLRVTYHIGGGTVVEGKVDCVLASTPEKISVVMYNQAEI